MDVFSPDFPSGNMLKEKNGKMPKVVIYTFYISNSMFGINSIRKEYT